jgi:plastocyanin
VYRKLLVVSAVAALSALLIACGGDDDDSDTVSPTAVEEDEGSSAGPGDDATIEVDIVDFTYEPASISVESGSFRILAITNNGDLPHTFTIDGLIDTMEMAPGESQSITVSNLEPGTKTFYCTIHGAARMSGELTVN